ncbi:MAG: hypothetical protein ACKV2T_19265 [Kofleriaceae bacterium]
MRRLLLLLLVASFVWGCKDKEPKREPKAELPVGSGSDSGSSAPMPNAKPIDPPKGTAPKLAWKDPEGELLIATEDGKTLTGPCGMTGTLTATEVTMGTQKPEPWNKLLRDGKKYSLPKLDWIIEVSPTGEVVLKQHGDKKPLGTVTGLDTDEAATWFGAFVVAAPMVQHAIEWTSPDGKTKLTINGAADFRGWSISEGTTKLASRQRGDASPILAGDLPAWDPTKIGVAIDGPKKYIVAIKRDDDATKAAFPADKFVVTEAEDGTLQMEPMGDAKKSPPKKLGKLTGRAACRAHDQALPALLWTLFGSKSAHAKVFGA